MLKKIKFFSILIIIGFFISPGLNSFAQNIDELEAKIAERAAAIKDLEAQIADTQRQIDANQGKQKTLSNAVATFEAERKKVSAQISLTEQKISAKELPFFRVPDDCLDSLLKPCEHRPILYP